MTDIASPVVSRRRLAAELRRLRSTGGHTLETVAEHLECSPAKISRIESGQVGARVQDVREMLDFYGVGGTDRDELLALVRQAKQSAWWSRGSVSEALQTLIGLEVEAASIATFQNYVVPGLLQTADYTRALLTSGADLDGEAIDAGVAVRMRRQEVLTRAEPPAYSAVIDEAVLHRPVGGAAVMRSQLRRLIEMAQQPAVTLQVVPLEAGARLGGSFSYVIFSFASLAEPKVVHTETLSETFYLNRAEVVGRYTATFDALRAAALDPTASTALIERMGAG